jgi:MYND finger.
MDILLNGHNVKEELLDPFFYVNYFIPEDYESGSFNEEEKKLIKEARNRCIRKIYEIKGENDENNTIDPAELSEEDFQKKDEEMMSIMAVIDDELLELRNKIENYTEKVSSLPSIASYNSKFFSSSRNVSSKEGSKIIINLEKDEISSFLRKTEEGFVVTRDVEPGTLLIALKPIMTFVPTPELKELSEDLKDKVFTRLILELYSKKEKEKDKEKKRKLVFKLLDELQPHTLEGIEEKKDGDGKVKLSSCTEEERFEFVFAKVKRNKGVNNALFLSPSLIKHSCLYNSFLYQDKIFASRRIKAGQIISTNYCGQPLADDLEFRRKQLSSSSVDCDCRACTKELKPTDLMPTDCMFSLFECVELKSEFPYCLFCGYYDLERGQKEEDTKKDDGKEKRVLSRCSQCKKSYYCCKEHQRLHWKMRHKNQCKRLCK